MNEYKAERSSKIPLIICSTVKENLPKDEADARKRMADGDISFAIIDGVTVILPPTAKFIIQDRNNIWYFSDSFPRLTSEDWNPEKKPIQYNENGSVKLLVTKPKMPWQDTRQKTICRKDSVKNSVINKSKRLEPALEE